MARDIRGGRLPEDLLARHLKMLRVQWWSMSTPDLWTYLHKITVAENRRYPSVIEGTRYFGDSRLQPQFRWRRLAVCRELESRGVHPNPALSQHSLPHRAWPGIIELMGKRPPEAMPNNSSKPTPLRGAA